jgi:hypothetical protein
MLSTIHKWRITMMPRRFKGSRAFLLWFLFLLPSLLSLPVLAAENPNLVRIPVGDQALAFEGGYIIPQEQSVGTVIGAKENTKAFFGIGDTLYIRFKRSAEIHAGDWVTVYRLTTPVFHPITSAYMGRLVKTLGLIEVTSEPNNRVAEARVVQPLDSISQGDPVMIYMVPAKVPDQGNSDEPVTGAIVEFRVPRQVTAQGEIVYIDLGAQDGIVPGDRFNVIRAGSRESLKTFLPDYVVAELKVIAVQERTATTKVVKSSDPVRRGDYITRIPRGKNAIDRDIGRPTSEPTAQ